MNGTTRRHSLRAALGVAAAAMSAIPAARAQQRPADDSAASYPDRSVRVLVPFAPGGGMDAMARAVAPFLAARLPGARVIVSNRAGAGGQVGTEAVANAAPDGFTLGACATPTVLSQPIERPVRWRAAELTTWPGSSRTPAGSSCGSTAPCATSRTCWRRRADGLATFPTAPRASAGTTTSPHSSWRRGRACA